MVVTKQAGDDDLEEAVGGAGAEKPILLRNDSFTKAIEQGKVNNRVSLLLSLCATLCTVETSKNMH